MPERAVYLTVILVVSFFTPPVGKTVHQSAFDSMLQSAVARTEISVLPAVASTVTGSGVTVKVTFVVGVGSSDDELQAVIRRVTSINTENILCLIMFGCVFDVVM
jgi:hypothetical protein